MARSRFQRGGPRGQRRLTSWFDIPAQLNVLSAVGGTIFTSLSGVEAALRPFTIERVHLELLIFSDQVAADEIQIGAVGMCVVSDQAAGAGVGSVPTPVTDDDSDLWFLHQYVMNSFLFVSAVGVDGQEGTRYSIDSKAKRKVTDSEDVLLIGEVSGAGDGITLVTAGRMLLKNH